MAGQQGRVGCILGAPTYVRSARLAAGSGVAGILLALSGESYARCLAAGATLVRDRGSAAALSYTGRWRRLGSARCPCSALLCPALGTPSKRALCGISPCDSAAALQPAAYLRCWASPSATPCCPRCAALCCACAGWASWITLCLAVPGLALSYLVLLGAGLRAAAGKGGRPWLEPSSASALLGCTLVALLLLAYVAFMLAEGRAAGGSAKNIFASFSAALSPGRGRSQVAVLPVEGVELAMAGPVLRAAYCLHTVWCMPVRVGA